MQRKALRYRGCMKEVFPDIVLSRVLNEVQKVPDRSLPGDDSLDAVPTCKEVGRGLVGQGCGLEAVPECRMPSID